MTVFDGEPRCHIDACFFVSKRRRRFWNTKSKSFFSIGHFLRDGLGRTSNLPSYFGWSTIRNSHIEDNLILIFKKQSRLLLSGCNFTTAAAASLLSRIPSTDRTLSSRRGSASAIGQSTRHCGRCQRSRSCRRRPRQNNAYTDMTINHASCRPSLCHSHDVFLGFRIDLARQPGGRTPLGTHQWMCRRRRRRRRR